MDSIVQYPSEVVLDYPNCDSAAILYLKQYGMAKQRHPQISVFASNEGNQIRITKDTLLIFHPSKQQRVYAMINHRIDHRVNDFDSDLGNRLYTAYNNTQIQKGKDFIRQLSDNIFKANVLKPNLDSVLMPAIKNNLKNAISLYAMDQNIMQARVFNIEIPNKTFNTVLESMPYQQKQNELWTDLQMAMTSLNIRKQLVGQVAPEFTNLKDTAGNKVSIKDFKNKALLIDFWTSLCGPYLKQLLALKQIYQRFKDAPIQFISISIDDNIASRKNAIIDNDIPWINISDLKRNNGKTSVDYNVLTVPHNFFY